MRQAYLLFLMLYFHFSQAQSVIHITDGAKLFIQPQVSLNLGGLVLIPSGSLLLNNISLERSTTVQQALPDGNIQRVYHFSNPVMAFSGIIRFHYEENELNQLPDTLLTLNIHNGVEWQNFTTNASHDSQNNFVETNIIAPVNLHELTLSTQTLPNEADNQPPVAICKPHVVLVAGSDCYAMVTTEDLDAGSYDPDGDWTAHSLLNTNGFFHPGNYMITYEVMDVNGAFSTCESRVEVVDHTPPVARARNLTLELGPGGQASISVSDVDDGSYDNCGPVTLSLNRTHFDCSDLGHLQVRLTVTDTSGNVSEALSDITLVDNTPPVIQAQDITLTLDANGRGSLSIETLTNAVSDNCGVTALSLNRTEFYCTDLGEQVAILIATDAAGNTSHANVKITIKDTLDPVVQARGITLDLDAAGRASLTSEAIDEGSSDNCSIASRTLQFSDFDCSNLGTFPVQYTVTDGSGNSTTVLIQVTIRDITAPEVLTRNAVLELDGNGKATLAVEEVDDASTDNCAIASRTLSQTEFTCADLGRRTVTLTLRDASGNESFERAMVEVKDPNGVCPCSYGVLAFNGIVLKSNEVSAGGVGVIKKKVKLRNTVINQEGTFVKAPENHFDQESEASIYIRGAAPQPDGFRNNPNKDKKKQKIGKGESSTLSAGRYGRVKVGADATLTFSGGEVFIRSLKVKKGAELVCSAPTSLLVRDRVKLAGNTALNTKGEQVSLYSGSGVSVGNASEIRGTLHTQGKLKTRTGREVTSLEGLFVANKIRGGKNTHWAGGGVMCTGDNDPEPTLAVKKERRKADTTPEALNMTDSTDTGIVVSIWPNPIITDRLNISVENNTTGGEFFLLDFLGNIISKKVYTGKQLSHQIDMTHASPGIYILRVVSADGKIKTLRVMKEVK